MTYRVYWITPFLGSWLASGISLRGRWARPVEPWGVTDVASFLEVVEMEARDCKGTIRGVGFAEYEC